MDLIYHSRLLQEALGDCFDDDALRAVTAANHSQDRGLSAVQNFKHYIGDAQRCRRYVDGLHARLAGLAQVGADGRALRGVFGRLTHTIQDFYAHSSYVAVWRAVYGPHLPPQAITAADPAVLIHPDFWLCTSRPWPDWALEFVPALRQRAWRLPPRSHAAAHLDAPERGPNFDYAMHAAERHTRLAFERVAAAVGPTARDRLCRADR